MSGHSQGASHAAYLSVARPVLAAVMLSGPQDCAECVRSWAGEAATQPTLRRAAYALREGCGDAPDDRGEYCPTHNPGALRRNLGAMGLARGMLGANASGYVQTDFAPHLAAAAPRPNRVHHKSVAKAEWASSASAAVWAILFDDIL